MVLRCRAQEQLTEVTSSLEKRAVVLCVGKESAMSLKNLRVLLASMLFIGFGYVGQAQTASTTWDCCHPSDGVIPDQKTAVAITKAILLPIYKQAGVDNQEPFSASLNRGVWTVSGAHASQPLHPVQPNRGSAVGGVMKEVVEVKISQANGMILKCCFPAP
jgi:hypothetical protein